MTRNTTTITINMMMQMKDHLNKGESYRYLKLFLSLLLARLKSSATATPRAALWWPAQLLPAPVPLRYPAGGAMVRI